MNSCLHRRFFSQAALWGPAAFGFILIAYATRLGPWAYSDSVEYIVAARNLLSGIGLGLLTPSGRFMPLSLHPPLYPLVLAGGGLLGADLLGLARWIGAVLFAILLLMVSGSARALTGSHGAAQVVSMIPLTSFTLVQFFTGAISEPLFIVLGLLALILVLRAIDHPGIELIVGAGLCAGLSSVTRYSGIAFVVTGSLSVMLGRGDVRAKIARGLAFAAAGTVPMAVWIVMGGGSGGGGLIGLEPLSPGQMWSAMAPARIAISDAVWKWMPFAGWVSAPPYRTRILLLMCAVIIVATVLMISNHRSRLRHTQLLFSSSSFVAGLVLSLTAATSALALAGSVALRVPAPDLNARTMAPTLLALTGASLCFLHAVVLAWFDRTWAVRAVSFAGLAAVLAQGPATYQLAVDLHRDGLGYTSQTWVESGTIEGIRHLDSDIVLISNETAAILLLTNRPAYDVPELQKGQRLTSFLRFGDGSEGAEQAFRKGGALVLFENIYSQLQPLYGDQTEARLEALTGGLRVYSKYSDGTIYLYPWAEE